MTELTGPDESQADASPQNAANRKFTVSDGEFEQIVQDALDDLPKDITEALDNVVFLIEADSPANQPKLLGLYKGHPLTARGWYGGDLPDQFFLYRNNLIEICDSVAQLRHEVKVTVRHEIGHYFGIEEDRLHELGWG